MFRILGELFFPQRIGRLSYVFRNLLSGSIIYPLAQQVDFTTGTEAILLALALLAMAAYVLLYVVVPRVRDCGMNAWLAPAVLVPVVGQLFGIILLFKPSRTPLQEYLSEDHPDEMKMHAGEPPAPLQGEGAPPSPSGDVPK